MKILVSEFGNQGSRYVAGIIASREPRVLRISPDLNIKSRAEAGDPEINPLLGLVMPVINDLLVQRPDLLALPFPHDTDPSVLIADPLRDRGYHEMLVNALRGLTGGVISGVEYNQSFYKY